MSQVSFVLNGSRVRLDTRDGESLLETLRGRCGIKSAKNGCSPQGQCGACLVLVDGHPRTSCATPADAADGRTITTLEGIPEDEQRALARSFVAAAGLQCGFCIPGIALRAHALLEKNPDPGRDEIARAIDGHLCRCTGYAKIVDAIELFARVRRGEAAPEIVESGGVGARLARWNGLDLALGKRPFIDDMERPGMLHGALVLSPHARARVVSIDTRCAHDRPGVAAVLTATDVPGRRWYGILESDWPGFVAIGEEVRYAGDVVAAVAAVDERTAREAAALVEVKYDILPALLSPEAALDPAAPRVNPMHDNLLGRTKIVRGDADRAIASSAHVVRGTWKTQRIEHLFLEPESALAEPLDDGRLHVYSGGQGIFDDQRQIAAFLGLPLESVRVEQVSAGGAFGGKEDLSVQAQTALLAFKTRKPVKLTLNRQESIRIHPKRHPVTLEYTAACDADGKLTAVKARITGDSGAYASVGAKVLERAAGHACGAYEVPNVDVESIAVYTNNPPSGAMRGFGVNQANFAMEGCIDLLAKRCGLDPWEMRWRNALDVGSTITTGQVLEKSVGLKKTLLAVRPAYDEAKSRGRAAGIACGLKNSGLGNGVKEFGRARLVVENDGTVSIYNSFSEVGQGLLTVLVQFAVEVTGLSATVFRPKVDTRFALDGGQTTGSRATLLAGRAVVDAATKLRADLDREKSLARLKGREYAGETIIDDTTAVGSSGAAKTHTAFGFATQLCILDDRGHVERIVAAHDVGRAVNPAFCEGQIEGAVHMGLGYALTEELPCPDGMPATFKLMEIGVLRATDMPPVDVILVEEPEPEGPFGAKGLGEIGLVPTAAAVAGALEAFDGIRRTTLPMKNSAAAQAMRAGHVPVVRRQLEPGRVNAHTHLYSGLAPLGMPREETRDFLDILRKVWWRLDRALDERSLRAAARFYVAEALLSGTTFLVDHHESPNFIKGSLDVIADVCQELGVRALLCYGATERNGGRDEAQQGLLECMRFVASNARPLVLGCVGLHASFTVSDETIRDAGDLCRSLGVRMHVHVAEDRADVIDAKARGFESPLQRLAALRGIVTRSIVAHGVHLAPIDLRLIDDLHLWVIQNARSNAANRVGYPLQLPPRVALGTDGFPSDLAQETNALVGHEAQRVIESRLKGGADLARELMPESAADSVVVENGRVRDVTIAGRPVVRDGTLQTGDIGRIRSEAETEAARLWQRMKGFA